MKTDLCAKFKTGFAVENCSHISIFSHALITLQNSTVLFLFESECCPWKLQISESLKCYSCNFSKISRVTEITFFLTNIIKHKHVACFYHNLNYFPISSNALKNTCMRPLCTKAQAKKTIDFARASRKCIVLFLSAPFVPTPVR